MFVLHQMIITTGPQSTSLPRRSSCPHLLMRMMSILLILIVAISPIAAAVVETNSMPQTSSAATSTDCDCAPSVLWPVLLTLLAVLIAAGASYLFWRYYWSVKHGKHLVLVTDLEKGSNEFAFDNPGFKEGSPIIAKKTQDEKKTRWIAFNENSSSAKMGNGKSQTAAPYGSISNSTKVEEQKQQNLSPSEPPSPSGTSVVPLKSRDFTGLGFNIRGNMRDGIFIKDLLHRGPASESGHIKPGDRIAAVRINFSHMVYEDAIAILSYASPYEVEIEIDQNATWLPGSLKNDKSKVDNNISHPFYRSQSFSDIQQIQKDESLMNGSKTTVSSPTSPETIIKPPAILQVSSEAAASERMPKYGGVKVLPDMNKEFQMVTEQKRNREHCVLSIDEVDNREKSISSTVAASSNSSNSVAAADFDEIDLTGGEKDEHENNNNRNNNNRTSTTNNVKSIIVKGIQNIKDKINNHIQQRNNSGSKNKSSSEKSSLEKDQINHLHHTKEEEESSQAAINKRKAPLPPASTASERDITEDNNNGGSSSSLLNEIDRQVVKKSNYTDNSSNFPEKIADNNNATNNNHSTVRLNASQITVHQYPNNSNNNDESDRKSASLGDLSTESATVVVAATSVLERAVSLELAETPQKKRRKAPMPPDDDAISDDDIAYYGKDGINGGSTILEVVVGSPGNRLKKSTVFGTMEEAVKQSSEDDDNVSILSIPDDDSLIASTPMMKNNHRWQVDEDIFLDPIEDELPVIPPDLPKSPVPDLPPKSAYVTEITVLNDNDDKYNNAARTDTTLFVTALESPSLSSPSSSSTSSSKSMTQHDVTSAAVVAGNDESADVTIKKNQSIDVDKSSESDRIVNGGEQSITTNDNVNIIGGGVSELGDDRELPKINSYEIVNYRQEPPTVVNQRDDDSSNKELFLSSEGGGDISKKRKSMADNNGNFSTEIFQSSKKTINLKYPSKITDNNNNNHHHHHNHKANNSMTNGGKIIKSSPSPAAVYYKTTKSISTNGSNGQHNNNGGVGGKIGSRIPVRANTEPNLKFSLLTAKEDDNNTTGKAGKKHITTTTGTNEKKLSSAYSTHNLSAKKSLSPIRVNGSNNIAR